MLLLMVLTDVGILGWYKYSGFEKLTGLGRNRHWLGHFYTMFFVILGWVLFRALNIGQAAVYIRAMFGIGAKGLVDAMATAYLRQRWIYYVGALSACLPLWSRLEEKLSGYKIADFVYTLGVLAVFWVSVSFISNDAYNPFIYFNF